MSSVTDETVLTPFPQTAFAVGVSAMAPFWTLYAAAATAGLSFWSAARFTQIGGLAPAVDTDAALALVEAPVEAAPVAERVLDVPSEDQLEPTGDATDAYWAVNPVDQGAEDPFAVDEAADELEPISFAPAGDDAGGREALLDHASAAALTVDLPQEPVIEEPANSSRKNRKAQRAKA